MKKNQNAVLIIITIGMVICFVFGNYYKKYDNNMNLLQSSSKINTEYFNICDVYHNKKAIVTIISDDGLYVPCSLFNRLLVQYEIPATVAGAVKYIEQDKTEWTELISLGYIDLISHSYNHIKMSPNSEISENIDALKHEILDSKSYYEQFTGKQQIAFVCPENIMCKAGEYLIQNGGYYACRRGNRGFNSLSPSEGVAPGDWFNLLCYGVMDKSLDNDSRNKLVDDAISENKWLIEMWHNVAEKEDGYYQTILYSDASNHLMYIKEHDSEVWIANFTDAIKYIREKQNTIINVAEYGNEKIVFSADLDTRLDSSVFNHPITISVQLPDEWRALSTVEVNGELKSVTYTDDKNVVIIDCIPFQQISIVVVSSDL